MPPVSYRYATGNLPGTTLVRGRFGIRISRAKAIYPVVLPFFGVLRCSGRPDACRVVNSLC